MKDGKSSLEKLSIPALEKQTKEADISLKQNQENIDRNFLQEFLDDMKKNSEKEKPLLHSKQLCLLLRWFFLYYSSFNQALQLHKNKTNLL